MAERLDVVGLRCWIKNYCFRQGDGFLKEYVWREDGSENVNAFPTYQDMIEDIYATMSAGDIVYIGTSTKSELDCLEFSLSGVLEDIENRLKERCDFLDDWDISSITEERKQAYKETEEKIFEEIKRYINSINEVPSVYKIDEEHLYR